MHNPNTAGKRIGLGKLALRELLAIRIARKLILLNVRTLV